MDEMIGVVTIQGVRYGHFLHSKRYIEYNRSIGKDVQEDYWEQIPF